MDIQLGGQRILVLDEREGADILRQRAMDKRTSAFGSGIGALLQRPKSEDVELATVQRRLEAFWHVVGRARYVYDRRRDYAVVASAPEVHEVTVHDTMYPVADAGRGARTFTLNVVEHCREEIDHDLTADARSGAVVADAAAVLTASHREVADPASLGEGDTVVVPPEQKASFVVRKLLAEMLKPVQADTIVEESLVLETTDLIYRPIWAFEFHWRSKDKRGVVELDGVTGAVRTGGALLPQLGRVITRDALFDIGADTIGLLVPGGSIAVKVARAALDKSY
ncbi:MAG TPA: hypothetical protein VFI34_12765 [Candidatus Limnocylindrales bacterium]|nr:hypothetical protein [Candidatus Limnocylindrales bacterium]